MVSRMRGSSPTSPSIRPRTSAYRPISMPSCPARWTAPIWGTVAFGYPGAIIRFVPGDNPPATSLGEVYNVPLPGFGVRGGDIDGNGVVWVSLGSGHLGSFDRRKCKGPLNGPKATGDQCPEGWTFYRLPGPSFADRPDESVEFELLHLGRPAQYARAWKERADRDRESLRWRSCAGGWEIRHLAHSLSAGLLYAKGMEGRIDDPNAGWKGRGLWLTSGDRTPWLKEGGKGTRPLVVHFQVRPDPLAK